MKYHEGYCDGGEGKLPMYPFDDEAQPPAPRSLEVHVVKLVAPTDASDVAAEIAIGGKDFKPSSQAETSLELHVSVA